MSVRFIPFWDLVLLRLEPEPELSSTIAVQKATEGLTRFGEVLAVGVEVKDVKVGQRVLASVTAGVLIGANGDTLVREDAILAIRHR